jgi:CHAT domain-containing protein
MSYLYPLSCKHFMRKTVFFFLLLQGATTFLCAQTPIDSLALKVDLDSAFTRARNLAIKQRFQAALPHIQQADSLGVLFFGVQHLRYATIRATHARILQNLNRFFESEVMYWQALAIQEAQLGKDHPECIALKGLFAHVLMTLGKYEEAEEMFLALKKFQEGTAARQKPDYGGTLVNLGNLYSYMSDYEHAEAYYLAAKKVFEEDIKKTDHPFYANCLGNLGALYWKIGDFERVEPLLLETCERQTRLHGKESDEYATCANNLAAFYTLMGNYKAAKPILFDVEALHRNTLGTGTLDYSHALNNLANFYQETGRLDTAELYFLKAWEIQKSVIGADNPDNVELLGNIGIVYEKQEKNQQAERFLLDAKRFGERVPSKSRIEYATCLDNLAAFYNKVGRYPEAEALLLESEQVHRQAFDGQNGEYASSLSNLGLFYWERGQENLPRQYLRRACDLKKNLLLKGTQYLSERELLFYTALLTSDLHHCFSHSHQNPTDVGYDYDNVLFYKGFLLNTVSQRSKFAKRSPQSADKFGRMQNLHRRLAEQYSTPLELRDNALINRLEAEANATEKDLIRDVAGFSNSIVQVKWQAVQAALKPREAALEIFHFPYFRPGKTDSVLYVALLVLPGADSPRHIPLFEEKQLSALLKSSGALRADYANRIYRTPAPNNAAGLESMIWKPLEKHLAGVKKLYYAPSGLLNRVNLGAVPIANGTCIGDQLQVIQSQSTRQLTLQDTGATSGDQAMLFGGIYFDSKSATEAASTTSEPVRTSESLRFTETDSTFRGGSWGYLPATAKEVRYLDKILRENGQASTLKTEDAATEEAFKSLSATPDAPSPRILHIATHGYFFPDPTSENRPRDRDKSGQAFKASEHPMLRSGLILSGGNQAWADPKSVTGREDGVLTAYEISQMDLSNTELVVLSACETGLGDIAGNEGVYGLQRAFKIAGAKYIIMSLWQVPDVQTTELMTAFYQNWLAKKMNIPEALQTAQRSLRTKYPNPYFWAGFILLE